MNNFWEGLWLRVKYVVVFTKKKVVTEICWVLLAFVFSDRAWYWWHILKQIFHTFFCLVTKLFTLGNIIFNSASLRWILNYLGWIIYNIKQNREYLLNIKQKDMNICLLMIVWPTWTKRFLIKFHPKWENICHTFRSWLYCLGKK